jgi:hypothetical protein
VETGRDGQRVVFMGPVNAMNQSEKSLPLSLLKDVSNTCILELNELPYYR